MKKITKLAYYLHSWLGLISGIFLLLLGLSGSALVFKEELDQMLNADLLTVAPTGNKLPLDTLYRQIGHARPNLAGIAWVNPDAPDNIAYEFRLYQNDGKLSTYDLGLASIDPYTGKFLRLGDLKALDTGLMHWITQFHWSFQLGIPGLLVATLFGITMLLSMITGLIIYRRFVWKVLLFRVKIKRTNWRTICSGSHRIIGVWTLLINLVIFFTGFWMNKFSFDRNYWHNQQVKSAKNTMAVRSVDSLLKNAKQAMPELIIKNIYLPTQPGKQFRASGMIAGQPLIFFNGNSVSVDPKSGRVMDVERLARLSLSDRLEATFFPLHTGSYGNVIIKIVYVILGLTPGLLSITGAALWFRKRSSKAIATSR